MKRLAGQHKGERALIVFGGPSILETRLALDELVGKDFVVFLESKALTPRFLEYGLAPDYYLMPYPEKCKSTAFQTVVVQSILADIDIAPLVKDECQEDVAYVKAAFDDCFYFRNKLNVPHKKYVWRPDVYFEGSPFSLLDQIPDAALISMKPSYDAAVRDQVFSQEVHFYDLDTREGAFDVASYYQVDDSGEVPLVPYYKTTNSAASAFFSLLNYMGFKEAYFLGFDMSMMGSMEYAVPFSFRSLEHYAMFFEQARPVFSASFPTSTRQDAKNEIANRLKYEGVGGFFRSDVGRLASHLAFDRPVYSRPWNEFRDLASALNGSQIQFKNVYEPYHLAWPVPGVETISFENLKHV